MKQKKVQSKGKKSNKEKMYLSNDEEEKVPNEHPPKRHSIGINFYQTNYFSQSVENVIKDNEYKDGEVFCMNREEGCENRKRVESVSVKRRMPTVIPSNSPGDEIEFN